jgi:hypothetical protein
MTSHPRRFIVTAVRTSDLIQQESLAQHRNTSGREELADEKSKSKDCGRNRSLETFHPSIQIKQKHS